MKIGKTDYGEKPLFLAPMEGVTDASFRLMCKEFGADMVYTEFVSADALIRHIKKTQAKLEISDEERPVAIQIYGRDSESMAEAARICEAAAPDIIDINFGCPVKRVAGKGAGAGLLRDRPKMLQITRAVVESVSLPVTVKTRLGWDHENRIIETLAEELQSCGIAALTIHGRTRSQMYTGQADWEPIKHVKENPRINIPVIGNGDITTPQKAVQYFNEYKTDAIMIGRGAIGNPWIFRDIKGYIESPDTYRPLTPAEKMEVFRRQMRESIARLDERRGILHIRRHLAATSLFKGIPDFRETRIAMLRAETADELEKIFDKIETTYLKQ